MRCFRSGFVAALSLIIVYGRPEDSYSLDSLDSTFSRENSYSFDSLDSTLTDPAFDNFYLDSPEFDAFSPNNPVYPLDQDSNTYSWDLASLPNCETQGSLTNDFLQARDETLCPTNEPEGNVNLPTQLFQDPLQYLNDGLKTPPVGQDAQPGPGLTDEDFNFNAFVRNRPKAVLNYVEDESICSRRRYGLSNTPVCHYPNRGSTPSAGVEGEYTLYDVSPYLPGIQCLLPSLLWCCKEIKNRPPNQSFAHEAQIDTSGMSEEQIALFNGLLQGYYDAYECYQH